MIWSTKYDLYATISILLEQSFKYESNDMLSVTYKSYIITQIISQSFISKCVVPCIQKGREYMFYFSILTLVIIFHACMLQTESVVFPMHFLIQYKFLFSHLKQIFQ
jgi:hypothetical protein